MRAAIGPWYSRTSLHAALATRMCFDFPIYFPLLRLARREQNPRNRRKLLFRLLVTLPAIATFHAICFLLDPILFPGLRRRQVRAKLPDLFERFGWDGVETRRAAAKEA